MATTSGAGKYRKTGAQDPKQYVRLNLALDQIDDSVSGLESIALADANYTLVANEYRSSQWKFTGTLTANRTIYAPALPWHKFIRNATSGGHSLIIARPGGGASVTVIAGDLAELVCDGSDVVAISELTGGGAAALVGADNIFTGNNRFNAPLKLYDNPQYHSYSSSPTASPNLQGVRMRGTEGSPTPPLSGDRMMQLIGRFKDSGGTLQTVAHMRFEAAENLSDSARGGRVIIATVPNGSTTVTDRVTIENDGSVAIPGAITTATAAVDTNTTQVATTEFAVRQANLAKQNLLTNGGFEIWQRGAGAFTGNNIYTSDRWQIIHGAGSPVVSTSRDNSNQDTDSQYCAAVSYTHGTSASALRQLIEDYWQLRGHILTFSVRVKCSTASACQLQLNDTAGSTFSSYHTGSGNYETLSVTRVISASTVLLRVQIVFAASATIYLDNAVLAEGAVTVPYAPLHPSQDLLRCQRYYEVNTLTLEGYQAAGGSIRQRRSFAVPKAGTPTLTRTAGTVVNVASGSVTEATPSGYTHLLTATATGSVSEIGGTCVSEYNP